jgi:hypothetical protein
MGVPTFEEMDVGRCPEAQAPDETLRPTPLPREQISGDDMGVPFFRGILYAAPIGAFLWALGALSVWLILGD